MKAGACVRSRCFDFPKLGGSIGDGLLLPGSDPPFDSPTQGGARFKRPVNGGGDWQWALSREFHWLPTGNPVLDIATTTYTISQAANTPENHFFFPETSSLNSIMVKDCNRTDGTKITLTSQLLLVLAGRLGQTGYACVPQ